MRVNVPVFLPDYMILLKYLGDGEKHIMTKVSEITDMTYPHIFKMKKVFYGKGWINIEKDKNKHYITITERGKAVVDKINELMVLLGITDEQLKELRKLGKIKKDIAEEKIEQPNIPEEAETLVKEEVKDFNQQFIESNKNPLPKELERPRHNLPPIAGHIVDNKPGGDGMPYSNDGETVEFDKAKDKKKPLVESEEEENDNDNEII